MDFTSSHRPGSAPEPARAAQAQRIDTRAQPTATPPAAGTWGLWSVVCCCVRAPSSYRDYQDDAPVPLVLDTPTPLAGRDVQAPGAGSASPAPDGAWLEDSEAIDLAGATAPPGREAAQEPQEPGSPDSKSAATAKSSSLAVPGPGSQGASPASPGSPASPAPGSARRGSSDLLAMSGKFRSALAVEHDDAEARLQLLAQLKEALAGGREPGQVMVEFCHQVVASARRPDSKRYLLGEAFKAHASVLREGHLAGLRNALCAAAPQWDPVSRLQALSSLYRECGEFITQALVKTESAAVRALLPRHGFDVSNWVDQALKETLGQAQWRAAAND